MTFVAADVLVSTTAFSAVALEDKVAEEVQTSGAGSTSREFAIPSPVSGRQKAFSGHLCIKSELHQKKPAAGELHTEIQEPGHRYHAVDHQEDVEGTVEKHNSVGGHRADDKPRHAQQHHPGVSESPAADGKARYLG